MVSRHCRHRLVFLDDHSFPYLTVLVAFADVAVISFAESESAATVEVYCFLLASCSQKGSSYPYKFFDMAALCISPFIIPLRIFLMAANWAAWAAGPTMPGRGMF